MMDETSRGQPGPRKSSVRPNPPSPPFEEGLSTTKPHSSTEKAGGVIGAFGWFRSKSMKALNSCRAFELLAESQE
jgi:hypothetical protein